MASDDLLDEDRFPGEPVQPVVLLPRLDAESSCLLQCSVGEALIGCRDQDEAHVRVTLPIGFGACNHVAHGLPSKLAWTAAGLALDEHTGRALECHHVDPAVTALRREFRRLCRVCSLLRTIFAIQL